MKVREFFGAVLCAVGWCSYSEYNADRCVYCGAIDPERVRRDLEGHRRRKRSGYEEDP